MEKWQENIILEKQELDDKIKRLDAIITRENNMWDAFWEDESKTLLEPTINTMILSKQKEAMLKYSAVLNERIILFKEDKDGK